MNNSDTDTRTQSDEGGEFAKLMERLKAGDGNAWAEFEKLFTKRIVGLVKRRKKGMRLRDESTRDFVQHVLLTFATGVRERYDTRQLNTAERIWALLSTIACRKIRDKVKKANSAHNKQVHDMESLLTLPAPGKSPLDQAILVEEINFVKQKLSSLCLSRVFEGLINGETNERIASELGCTEATVARKIKSIVEICELIVKREPLNAMNLD